jgi:leucyl aminopeptidase
MNIRFINQNQAADLLIIPVFADAPGTRQADAALQDTIKHAILCDATFRGKRGQSLVLPAPADSGHKKIVLFGVGNADSLTAENTEELGGALNRAIKSSGYSNAVLQSFAGTKLGHAECVANLASGAVLKSYAFDKYKSAPGEALDLSILTPDVTAAEAAFAPLKAIARGAFLARDVANEPPNVLYPASYATRIKDELEPLGVKVTILYPRDLIAMGAGGIMAVGQGSAQPPRMVIMEYNGTGADKSGTDLALVGKGITFDTGGISIKPSSNMAAMKFDMGGSAAVVGTMCALAGRKSPSRVVGIVALAENMPGPNAVRPGDIITALNGKTVEIDNTDAEGRLVLMDALTYVQRQYKPKTVIDLATLTGAVRVALGNVMAGVFSNSDTLWKKIEKAGNAVNEPGWRLPLHQRYTQAMQSSEYADLINSSSITGAGASTAAAFLEQFIEPGVKWAHCDIAAMASGASNHALLPDRIGNGFGVRMLDRLVRDSFERKAPAVKLAPAANNNTGGCGNVCTGSCSRHPQP